MFPKNRDIMRVYETEAGQRLFDPVPARRENRLFDLTG